MKTQIITKNKNSKVCYKEFVIFKEKLTSS
jgi:hypothetical protein